MIDEKKIEKAAKEYGKKKSEEYSWQLSHEASFKAGIHWFKENLWHSVNEVAKDHSDLVYVNINNEVRSTEDYNRDLYDDNFGFGWKAYVRNTDLVKWAYKEDLLPFLFKEK